MAVAFSQVHAHLEAAHGWGFSLGSHRYNYQQECDVRYRLRTQIALATFSFVVL